MTVLDNVMFGLKRRGDKDARRKALEASSSSSSRASGGRKPRASSPAACSSGLRWLERW